MKIPLLLLFLLYTCTVAAQHPYIRHYTVDDGLASNNVYSADQDSKGYIWLATDNGVSRFDGKEFRNFSAREGLPDNEIVNLEEDAGGRIWLSCFNGALCYIRGNKVFTAKNDPALKGYPSNFCMHMCRVGQYLWMSNGGYNNYLVDTGGQLRPVKLGATSTLSKVGHHVIQSVSYLVWKAYLYDERLRRLDSVQFDINSGLFKRVVTVSVLSDTSFCPITEDGYSYIFGIRNNRLRLLKRQKVPFPLWVAYYYAGKCWTNSNWQGIIPVTGMLQRDPTRPVLFAGKQVQNFLEDREGNYWACTKGEGIFMIPDNGMQQYTASNGFGENNILRLAVSGQELILGFNQVRIRELSSGRSFLLHNAPYQQYTIECMAADSQYIAAGSLDGLRFINRNTGNTVLLSKVIKCVARQSEDTFLFGTSARCFRATTDGRVRDTVFKGRVTAVAAAGNGDVILGTHYGLLRCRKTAGSWQYDTLFRNQALKKMVTTCIASDGNTIMAGTGNMGLVLFDGRQSVQVVLGPDTPLVNCRNIRLDREGQIWLATGSGIYIVRRGQHIQDYRVRHIDKSNGLLSDDISDIAIVNDTVYVAGSKGLTAFARQPRQQPQTTPSVYVSDVLINGSSRLDGARKISSRYDAANIEIHVSAIDFRSMGHIRFRYRMLGINPDWQYTASNSIRFESLPPGEYTFEVYARNATGVWSAVPALVRLEISPPWWATIWSYLALFLLFISFFYLGLHWLMKRKHGAQLRDASLKRQMAEIRLKAIKAQINPHFIFNTLNAIQYFIGNDQVEAAEHYLAQMAVLLRKTLEFSEHTAVSIAEEAAYLERYLELEHIRFDDSFTYSVRNDLPADAGFVQIPPMVLQPHMENALRHGLKMKLHGDKILLVSFCLRDNNLVCEVKDNGIGRVAAAAVSGKDAGHRSRGVELSEMKLQMYSQVSGKKVNTQIIDLYNSDNSAAGTLVRITISL